MVPLSSEQFDALLNEAAAVEDDAGEYVKQHYMSFMEEKHWSTLFEFFEEENWPHYDEWEEKECGTNFKRLKQILRGKDMVQVVAFALDMGRLIGRAEAVILSKETGRGK
ncbi:MAG: hypothetical protein SR3Q1_09060 [Quinella sp. 3Q1]|nr:hypothetical protein [Quinella sp. 3Q1]